MNFNASNHEIEKPNGRVQVRVMEARHGRNNSGTGDVLRLKLEIVGHQDWAGIPLYANFNTAHQNTQAAKIGLGELSECSRALRHHIWGSEQELVGKIGWCEVQPDGSYTRVKRWLIPKPMSGTPASNPHRDGDAARYAAPAPNPAPAQGYQPQPVAAPAPAYVQQHTAPAPAAGSFPDDVPF